MISANILRGEPTPGEISPGYPSAGKIATASGKEARGCHLPTEGGIDKMGMLKQKIGGLWQVDRKMSEFSLHAQGWPARTLSSRFRAVVLPARAGMARVVVRFIGKLGGSPCTRRDGPP